MVSNAQYECNSLTATSSEGETNFYLPSCSKFLHMLSKLSLKQVIQSKFKVILKII